MVDLGSIAGLGDIVKKFGVLTLALVLVGCASDADEIAPAYTSPIIYQNYDCQQLAAEASRVSSRASAAAGIQDEKASTDAIATGVAVVLFWPAAFFVSGGDGQTAAELARLRGHMDAIEQASIQKRCGIEFRRPGPKKKKSPATNCTAQQSAQGFC